MRTLRVFISSPGDVRSERVRAYDVVTRLQTKFRAFLKIEPILWEHEAMRGTATFQSQIIPPSKTDIVICILWARIGMRLPQDYKRPDGTIPTGTEWEFEDAYLAHQLTGTPDLLVYRKTAAPTITVTSDEQLEEWRRQKKALDGFLERWFKDHEGAFKAAFNTFETDEEFEKSLYQHLEKIIKELLLAHAPVPGLELSPTWFEGSPFRGLNAFQPEHAPVFFGRDLAIREITERLLAQASAGRVFLMVLGMSGCGKSSLVRAGVLPELLRPGVVDAVGCWRWLILRPGESSGTPIEGLAAALFGGKTALPELASLGYDVSRLSALLRDAPVHSIPVIQAALEEAARGFAHEAHRANPPVARLILIIDQLEEIFTIERFDDAQRAAFITAIAALSRSGLVWVLATMRSDLYARCAEVEELLALRADDGQYDLSPPSFSELGEMIRSPARAAGLHFEPHPETRQKLDDALHDEACKSPAALPLLEFCLEELYKLKTQSNLITWEAYQGLGGLTGAISKRAEEVYNNLSGKGREALPSVLGALVTVAETVAARPALRNELIRRPGGEEVVNAYSRASLFVTDIDQSGEAVVALAHEALMTSWPRMQSWLRDNQEFLRAKARLEETARRWQVSGKDRDYLLAEGKPLAEAEDVLKKRRAELAEGEVEFIEACLKAAARRRRKNRLVAAGVLTVVLSLIFGSVIVWQVQKTKDARAAADAARLTASETDFALASIEIEKDNVAVSLAYLADALRKNPTNEAAIALAVSILRNCPLPTLILHHSNEVHDASFSPDGARVVTASADGTARLWDAHTGQPIGEPMRHEKGKWVHMAKFSPNGDWLVTASWDGTARVWSAHTAKARINPQNGGPVVMKHDRNRVTAVSFSPDGQSVATACWDGKARLWDARSGEPLRVPQTQEPIELPHDPNGIIWSVDFSPDGQRVATASEDTTARLWDAQTGKLLQELPHDRAVNGASFSPDGRWIVTGSQDNKARIWHGHTGNPVMNPKDGKPMEFRHDDGVIQPVFSPDSSRIVTSSYDKTARVWDARTGTQIGQPMRHEGWVRIARFSPDGRLVLTASYDGTARVWDASSGKPFSDPLRHGSAVYAANFSPDGQRMITASFDNTARLWEIGSGKRGITLYTGVEIESASFSPNGQWVVTASADGKARVWNARTGDPLVNVKGETVMISHTNKINAAKFSPDGQRVATASADRTACLWDARTGEKIGSPMSHGSEVVALNFSPDGHRIVTASTDGIARLWDGLTGEALLNPQTRQPMVLALPSTSRKPKVTAASFSPDGNRVVTASMNGEAQVWDVQTGAPVGQLMRHDGIITSACFSPDGKRVLTASNDHHAQLWDAQTGAPVLGAMWHDHWVDDAEFSPDGQWVVTASADGTARVWDRRTGQLASQLMRHQNAVTSATFSPDGQWVVTASADGTARLWDARTGLAVSESMSHSNKVTTARFSPDGKWVVTASADGTARIWEAPIAAKEAPSWLWNLVEDVGGLHLSTSGVLVPATQDVALLRKQLRELPGTDDLSRFGRWLVADPATRSVSPIL
jgi:WD40 repeat protein